MDIRCPQCGTLYEVDDERVGASAALKCRECQHIFRLGADATPSREDQQRWMVRDPGSGDVLYFDEFDTLHQWIMERKVDRTWEISRTSEKWKTLGDIGEFAPVFQVVDNVDAQTGGAVAQRPEAGQGDGRERRNTLKQFQSDEPAYREGARQARRQSEQSGGPSQRRRESSGGGGGDGAPADSREAAGGGGQNDVRLESDMFGSRDSRERRAAGGGGSREAGEAGSFDAAAESEQWSFGDEPVLEDEPADAGDDAVGFDEETVDYHREVRGRNWLVVLGVAVVLIGGGATYVAVFQPQLWERLRTRLMGGGEQVEQTIGETDDGDGDKEETTAAAPQEVAASRVSEATGAARAKLGERVAELVKKARERASEQRVAAVASARKKAESAAEEGGGSGPSGFDATLAAANRALDGGQAAKARRLFHRASDIQPDNSEAITGLGWALLNLGKPSAAAAQFRRAIHVNAAYGEAYIGLGSAERELGHPEKALNAYKDYLERHPNGSSASIAEYQSKQLREQLGIN